MTQDKSRSGINIIRDVSWGTHLCHFYQTKEDLIDILVPYFKVGLENNEYCMWVTSEPLTEKMAEDAMRKAVPDFDKYIGGGQIEIVPHTEWYLKDGTFDLKRVLDAWIDKLNQALSNGYDGMRITGNTAWLDRRDWQDHAAYEEQVNSVIGDYQMIAICTYSLDQCGASEIIELVCNHPLNLIRQAGEWVIMESSERKRSKEVLHESKERLQRIFESVNDGITVTDSNGFITDLNEMALKMSGFKEKSDLIGKIAFETIAPHDRERALNNMQELIQLGSVGTAEYSLVKRDGSEYPAEISASVLQDSAGGPTGFVSAIRDITERKKMEEERQRAARLESVGVLAGGIAHDFNNLLTGIMGNIGLAKRYVEPEEKAFDRLLEAGKASLRARDLTQQLLTFAKGGTPVKKTASIAELIKDSATFALRGSNVRCEFCLPDDLWVAEVDEGQISQVISNLAINADESMPEGGIINMSAKNTAIRTGSSLPLRKGKYIEIRVEDHGTGIRKEHLERIFDPYFTTKQKGSGLGLATTYSIIKNHNGYITAHSELAVGTTFHIYLPASQNPISVKKEVIVEDTLANGKGRILIMDDEEVIRELLLQELSDAGYEVELTKDGAEAIEQYAKAKKSGQPFDAVIMDVTIPGGTGGKEAIKQLLEIDPEVEVIVSSGYANDSIIVDFRDYGFRAAIAKPYKITELEKTLHSVVKRAGD